MGRPRKQKTVASKAPCPGKHCQEHLFEMTSINSEKKPRLDCRLEFCPMFSK